MGDHIDGETLAAWAAREVEGERAAALRSHLEECAACRERLAAIAAVDAQLAALPRHRPGEEWVLDTRRALRALRETPAPEILTLAEVADYLRVSVEDIERGGEGLPFFELAGRLRIRRAALLAWIEDRERDHQRAVAATWAATARNQILGKGVAS
jgi:hypothetical protein